MAAHPTLPSPVSTSLLLLLLLLLSCCYELCAAATVSYDHRAVVIDGKRRVLLSGSIHYPRSTPEMWPDLIQKSKDGGLDVIETYVFWNLHEPVQGQKEMQKFTTKIVDMMKKEKLFASQVEDLAFAVARFFQRGGTFQNYYMIGLKGEKLALHDNTHNSTWMTLSSLPRNQPLTWYMTYFDAPKDGDPVAIDFTGMGKGEAWVNGHSIGRYWPTYTAPPNGCVKSCDYRGQFSGSKCVKNCGQPSQSLYHVPRSLIQQGKKNRLVLFEEVGGDPTLVSFALRKAGSLCAHVSQSHPPPVDAVNTAQRKDAVLHLECPHSDHVISSVKFASFGTPHGTCRSYSHGNCSSTTALAILQHACIGVRSCDVKVSTEVFGDPCRDVVKSLAVEASCSSNQVG
ncbi:hypothetical protein BHM03_00006603 [Ensete ventricosum]|nr:hypothetical protein BHM03_00006603 [Ensete ventricosum]